MTIHVIYCHIIYVCLYSRHRSFRLFYIGLSEWQYFVQIRDIFPVPFNFYCYNIFEVLCIDDGAERVYTPFFYPLVAIIYGYFRQVVSCIKFRILVNFYAVYCNVFNETVFQITGTYRLIASRKVFICQGCNLQAVIIGCLSQLLRSFGFEFCYLQPVLSCNAFNGEAYIASIVSVCIAGKCTVIVYFPGSECCYFVPRLVVG